MVVGLPAERVALVTGAAGAIGGRIAELLARDGYTVAGTDVVAPPQPVPGVARHYLADVGRPDEIQAVVDRAVEDLGPLRAVVVAAGVASQRGLLDIDPDELDRVLRVNVVGAFFTVQAAYRHFEADGLGGRIVVLSSLAAAVGGVFAGPHYSASKAAVEGLVRSVAKSGAAKGILANTVAPGVTATPMTADFGYRDEQFPLGRVAQPDDIAGAVAYLCSDAARYMTGTTMHVNGGMYFG
jgi:3-oxoacyl-[acyl-carrier protein] reductase